MKELLFPTRKKDSHKGDNGRVLIVGGNETFHGAPILATLGAEKSGADLMYLVLPRKYEILAREASRNLVISTFIGDFLTSQDVS